MLCIIAGYVVCKILKISESKQAIVSSKTFNAALVSKKLFHKRTFEMEIPGGDTLHKRHRSYKEC